MQQVKKNQCRNNKKRLVTREGREARVISLPLSEVTEIKQNKSVKIQVESFFAAKSEQHIGVSLTPDDQSKENSHFKG